MADETTTVTEDKPLNADQKIDPPKPFLTTAGEPAQIEPPPAYSPFDPDSPENRAHAADMAAKPDVSMSALERLRAFEDKHFGEKAVRINGRIERGSGSPFQMAHPSVREGHSKIEKLIEAEQKLATAHAALIAADTEHEDAEQAVAAAEQDADAAEQ